MDIELSGYISDEARTGRSTCKVEFRCKRPQKAHSNVEKEKKELYLKDFLERRRTFTPMG